MRRAEWAAAIPGSFDIRIAAVREVQTRRAGEGIDRYDNLHHAQQLVKAVNDTRVGPPPLLGMLVAVTLSPPRWRSGSRSCRRPRT
jgi:hypothetical protein